MGGVFSGGASSSNSSSSSSQQQSGSSSSFVNSLEQYLQQQQQNTQQNQQSNTSQQTSAQQQQQTAQQQAQSTQQSQNLSKILGSGLSPELQGTLLSALGLQAPATSNAANAGLNTATGVLNSGGVANGAANQNLQDLWNSNVGAGIQNLNTETFGPQGLEAQINNQMADRGMGNSSAAVQGAQSVTPYYENALSQILNNANTNYYNSSLAEPLALAGLGVNTANAAYGQQAGTLGTLLSSDVASGGQQSTATGTMAGSTTGSSTGSSTGSMVGASSGSSTGSTTSTTSAQQSASGQSGTQSSSSGTSSGSSSNNQTGFQGGLQGGVFGQP